MGGDDDTADVDDAEPDDAEGDEWFGVDATEAG